MEYIYLNTTRGGLPDAEVEAPMTEVVGSEGRQLG